LYGRSAERKTSVKQEKVEVWGMAPGNIAVALGCVNYTVNLSIATTCKIPAF
jgi:hypothetical protein